VSLRKTLFRIQTTSLALFSPAAFCIVHGESHRRRRRRTVILKAREVID